MPDEGEDPQDADPEPLLVGRSMVDGATDSTEAKEKCYSVHAGKPVSPICDRPRANPSGRHPRSNQRVSTFPVRGPSISARGVIRFGMWKPFASPTQRETQCSR